MIASFVKNLAAIEHVWLRFILPLWFFGGTQFSWQTIYNIAPYIGYLTLLDPLVYVMEGMRAAVLGQEGNLPFWLCVAVLWVLTVVFGWWAIKRLKTRLDFV